MLTRMSKLGITMMVAGLATAGCDDGTGPTPPTVDDVAGLYVAEEDVGTFTTLTDDEETDLLEAGASLSLTLDEDGTTSGTLFIPEGGDGGEDLEAELDGTWELAQYAVSLEIEAGTFLDGLTLIWSAAGLSADGDMDDDTTFELELEPSS